MAKPRRRNPYHVDTRNPDNPTRFKDKPQDTQEQISKRYKEHAERVKRGRSFRHTHKQGQNKWLKTRHRERKKMLR